MVRFLFRPLVAVLLTLTFVSVHAQPPRQETAGSSSTQTKSQDSKTDQKDKKDKKQKAKKGQDDELNTSVFSAQIANDVLGQIRDGLEGHSQRLLLSAFDGDKMDGYLTFEDQIQAMFDRYIAFRAQFRIMQQSVQGQRGVVLAIFDLEESPRNGPPLRRSQQVRFELERGRKGWKVVDFSPRGFFS